ncbi:phospholipase D family protein [Variovorax sp. LT1R16]|uniref:phospholipase D family protein n=1 Tax=Variovorax sp. LT1R16 TaxID=3443728 RepID=UPI003F4897ED
MASIARRIFRCTGTAFALAIACLSGCASLPPVERSASTWAITDVAGSPLARMVEASRPANATGRSGFRLLSDPGHAFEARLLLIAQAQRAIDVQYYVLDGDATGLEFLFALREAARRGVRVRLIVDDLHVGNKDAMFSALAALPGFEVRMFNPLPARGGTLVSRVLRSLHEIRRVNRRMHNKLLVADSSLSVSGGRNIANEYFMRAADANFIDIDVLATGDIVRDQSAAFDQYWNSEQVYPVGQLAVAGALTVDALLTTSVLPDAPPRAVQPLDRLGQNAVGEQWRQGRLRLFWAPAKVLVDPPEKIMRSDFESRFGDSVSRRTLDLLRTARSSVLISSPYFIPGDVGLGVMRETAANGAKTLVVTNSLAATDEPLVYAAYARHRRDMLALGTTLYEISPALAKRSGGLGDFGASNGRLHAKLAIVDERHVYIGSMNLDGRSASFNTELGLIIDSPELARNFSRIVRGDDFRSGYVVRLGTDGQMEWVERDAQGSETVHRTEPGTSWARAIRDWAISLFLDEELL